MRKLFVLLALGISSGAVAQEDYELRLGDSLVNIALDKPYNLVVNGKQVQLNLKMKDTLTYKQTFLSFKYPKEFKISSSMIDPEVAQLTIVSSEGTGIIIQKYESMNPTTLNELVLTELTKESINYGYVAKKSTYKKKLASGQEVEVTRSVLTYKDEVNIYEVASVGKKDAGLIMVTMKMDDEKNSAGQRVIDLMWRSIRMD
ncbi:MAG: hypothetical protein EOO06_08185 [Chitinophagaceae bacterium]|nr:MAG: hypothetical protein EOO06_08185 [Chitinophagaceae bacterium]